MFSFLLNQVSPNRPVVPLNRPGINHQSPHGNIGSPLLSPKFEHSSPVSKSSSNHYHAPQSNLYTSPTPTPTPTHRTLPKIPTSSNTNSPSLSLRSSTNANIQSDVHQQLAVTHTDSTSIKSDDSSSFSDSHLHPSQHNSSVRSPDTKVRSQKQNSSIQNTNNLTKSSINPINSQTALTPSNTGLPIDRVPSPSTSLVGDHEREENERLERELELKRKRLQIYVFVCRCVAYPFNSKQSSDMARKHLKITPTQYNVTKDRFLAFLNGKTHIEADEGNTNDLFFLLIN